MLRVKTMGLRRAVTFVLGLFVAMAAASAPFLGCADEDPRYGPPEAIRGRTIDYGTGATEPEPPAEGGTAGTTPQATFKLLFDSIEKTCEPCHSNGASGAKKFLAATAEETRALFKVEGYNAPNSTFYTKPQHLGPALTADQKKLVDAWIAAEAAGGGATDAGGGG